MQNAACGGRSDKPALSRPAEKRYPSAMDLLRRKRTKPVRGFLDDQFLIAMPGMKDDRFARAVIYMCAHSEEGAMGLMINQTQQMRFPDLLVQLLSLIHI